MGGFKNLRIVMAYDR